MIRLHDLDAERAVLGCSLLEPECWRAAAETPLDATDFHNPRHEVIWLAIESVVRAHGVVDTNLVHGQLVASNQLERAGGTEYLLGLTDTIPVVEHVVEHAKRVRNFAAARAAHRTMLELIATAKNGISDLDDYLDRCETAVAQACMHRTTKATPVSMNDAINASFQELVARAEARTSLRGFPTGFRELDDITSGHSPGDLIICAGRPGSGKTSFAMDVAVRIASGAQQPALFFSLEMPTAQLADRAVASDARVDLRNFRQGRIHPHDWSALTVAAGRLGTLPIEIVDRVGLTLLDVRREARAARRRMGGLGLIVVDYLQLLRPVHRDRMREREVAEIAQGLKELAKEERVVVLALSQLNRDGESRSVKDKRPQLSDLRESGAIEQAADVVLLLYRDEVYNPDSEKKGICEVNVAKHRNGPCGVAALRFAREYTRFDNLATTAGGAA